MSTIIPELGKPYYIYGDWFPVMHEMGHPLILPMPRCRNGELERNECYLLAYATRRFKPRRIMEFGTFKGVTTLILAANSPADAEVFTLDVKEKPVRMTEDDAQFCNPDTVGEAFRHNDATITPIAKKITQLWGDSLDFDFSQYYKSMDFIFIDGGHEYETVSSDLRNSHKMLRNPYEGIVFCHDAATWRPSVLWAVADFINETGLSLYVFAGTSVVGIGHSLHYLFRSSLEL